MDRSYLLMFGGMSLVLACATAQPAEINDEAANANAGGAGGSSAGAGGSGPPIVTGGTSGAAATGGAQAAGGAGTAGTGTAGTGTAGTGTAGAGTAGTGTAGTGTAGSGTAGMSSAGGNSAFGGSGTAGTGTGGTGAGGSPFGGGGTSGTAGSGTGPTPNEACLQFQGWPTQDPAACSNCISTKCAESQPCYNSNAQQCSAISFTDKSFCKCMLTGSGATCDAVLSDDYQCFVAMCATECM